MLRKLTEARSQKLQTLTLGMGLLLSTLGLLAGALLIVPQPKASADASNDVINGGFSTPQGFINTVRSNDSGSGHHDLQAVYAYKDFGLTQNMYGDFAQNAKWGSTCRDGNVYDGLDGTGKVVGTNASSIGRNQAYQHGGYSLSAGGTTFYGNANSQNFAAGTRCLKVAILYDTNGQAVFAVIQDCGNPVKFTPKTPPKPPVPVVYSCTQLTKSPVDALQNVYKLTVTGHHNETAVPVSATFYVGNGKTQTVQLADTSSGTASASYTINYPEVNKTYAVSAVLDYRANGQIVSTDQNNKACSTTIVATVPDCASLSGISISDTPYEIQYKATAELNGAKLVSADFNYGDGKTDNNVPRTTAMTVVVKHVYQDGTKRDVLATLHFDLNGEGYTAPACRALANPTTKTVVSECKPGVPMGDKRCEVCKYDASLPPDSDKCQPPCTNDTSNTDSTVPQCSLPNTGAGNTIAIFSAVVVGGFLVYRQVIYRRHKAAFEAAELGTSALPLADPMNDSDPLRDTPLEPKARRSFRRRQF